jgi:hypothetical protein
LSRRALTLLSVFSLACAEPARTAEIEYGLDWDLDRVELHADGTWSVLTDTGFEVHVLDGTLSTFGATLVPCEDDTLGEVARLVMPLWPRVAHAGHFETADPSELELPLAQPLAPPMSTPWGRVQLDVPAADYCTAHVLMGAEIVLDDGAPRRGSSLRLEMAYRRPGGDWQSRSVDTSAATGALLDISTSGAGEPGTRSAVVFVRAPGALFDGLDLSTIDDATLERELLVALSRTTRVVVSVSP